MTATELAPILEARDLSKRFGDVEVLHQVSLKIMPQEIMGLVGQNGAGKSTLIKMIAGAYQPDGGRMLLHGKPIQFRDPRDALRAGIATIYQELSLCHNLTVAENIFLGHMPRNRWGMVDEERMRLEANRLLEELGIPINPRESVGQLTLLERQLVEIAKAIHRNLDVLILDEPTSALSQREKFALYRIVRNLRQRASIIYISHYLEEVLDLCDRVVVLRDGDIIRDGPTSGLDIRQLVHEMVASDIKEFFPKHNRVAAEGSPLLRVANLTVEADRAPVHNAALTVLPGEIVALAGLAGSGASTLARALCGLAPHTGVVEVHGAACRVTNPRQGLRAGISYVTNDRKGEGLVMTLNSYDNGGLSILHLLRNIVGIITDRRVKISSEEQLRTVMFRGQAERPVAFLSGGNQQKVVFVKMAHQRLKPQVLVLNDPTRGVDIGAKRELYDLLMQMTHQGMAVVLVSTDLEEMVQLADRIYVFRDGSIVREVPHGINMRELQIAIEQKEGEEAQ